MLSCSKCGSKVFLKGSKFCPKCGGHLLSGSQKAPKHTNLLLFFGGTLFAVLLLLGTVLFLVFTPGELSFESDSLQLEIIGDGSSILEIPISLTNKLGMPLINVEITSESENGSISSCTTDENGICTLLFTPPKSAFSYNLEISLYFAGETRKFDINILPDYAKKIIIYPQLDSLPADGTSSIKIISKAFNHKNQQVPDGTLLLFELEPIGAGTLSANSCTTLNGECTILYTSSITPGNITLLASSNTASANNSILLLPLEPEQIILTIANNSLIGNGKSNTIIEVYLENKLGKPVSNHKVDFTTDLGTITSFCISGSDGKCSVTYTSAFSQGNAKITAFSSDISTYSYIQLHGFSDVLIELSFYPNFGDPIYPAFALNHGYFSTHMVELKLKNDGTSSFSGYISVSIPEWSSKQTNSVFISPGDTKTLFFDPPLDEKAFNNLQSRNVLYEILITDESGSTIFESTEQATLQPFNKMPWQSPYFGEDANELNNAIISWVTYEDPAILELLSDSAQRLPGNALIGYQQYSSGCGPFGLNSCTKEESTYLQMEAIYDELQSRGMHYLNAPGNYFSNAQTIYTPAQSLENGGANCIDGSIVFASAIVSAGMHAFLILVPSHAFVCVQAHPTSNYIACVETTMISSGDSFYDASSQGESLFINYNSKNQLNIIDVNYVLSDGMKTFPN
ncbi:MAG: invasin domain 3-containing protein [Candidatus ainarchaeum sp.]|nr:invasin domain 3-containing protein [Candidatus ainarchaeum sp.]